MSLKVLANFSTLSFLIYIHSPSGTASNMPLAMRTIGVRGAIRPLYRSLPYSQSQGQPHVMASLGQSGQIVVKLMRVKVSNDGILIGLFGTAFDDSIGS